MTTTSSQTDDKTIVRDYFNATGFERWQRIYGDGEVNKVQYNIRIGHQRTVDSVLGWLIADASSDASSDASIKGLTICDAGCGVGSLSIPLAAAGATVYASDISEKMVGEAKERAEVELGQVGNPAFQVQDLEALSGKYHTVVCLDVIIHYPQTQAASMIQHLGSLAESRLIISFAPKTVFYTALKKVGSFFPGASKATRSYLHSQADVIKALEADGWKINRTAFNKAPFYFSRLIEAVR